jgi:hypothetical protein
MTCILCEERPIGEQSRWVCNECIEIQMGDLVMRVGTEGMMFIAHVNLEEHGYLDEENNITQEGREWLSQYESWWEGMDPVDRVALMPYTIPEEILMKFAERIGLPKKALANLFGVPLEPALPRLHVMADPHSLEVLASEPHFDDELEEWRFHFRVMLDEMEIIFCIALDDAEDWGTALTEIGQTFSASVATLREGMGAD